MPVNPISKRNLRHDGRPTDYGEPKRSRSPTVTDLGWRGVAGVARALGVRSPSELIEQIGRRRLRVLREEDWEQLEAVGRHNEQVQRIMEKYH